MTFALTLSAVALSLQPAALLQIGPSGYPTPPPTPVPAYGPTRNPAATYNPATLTPGRPDQPPSSAWSKYQYQPWDARVAPYAKPAVPQITLTPALPPKVVRGPPPVVRTADVNPGRLDKMLDVDPTVVPTGVPTPTPSRTYVPVQGYALPMHPRSTPTPQPTGGYMPVQGYALPYHPASTPTPVPTSGYVPAQGYALPIHPVHPPTPTPTPIVATGPYRPVTGDVPFVGLHPKKPVISVIPKNPAARFRTASGEHA